MASRTKGFPAESRKQHPVILRNTKRRHISETEFIKSSHKVFNMTSKVEDSGRPDFTDQKEDDHDPTPSKTQKTEKNSDVQVDETSALLVNKDAHDKDSTATESSKEVEESRDIVSEEKGTIPPKESSMKDEHLDSKVCETEVELDVPCGKTEEVSEKKVDLNVPCQKTEVVSEKKAEVNVQCEKTEVSEKKEEPDVSPEQKPEDGFLDLLGNGQLTKKVLRKGKPNKSPRDSNLVTARIKICLEDGKCVQDSVDTFVAGDGDVIQAVDMILPFMEEYEIATIVSAARFGYGSYGREPSVPPDANLVIEVELQEVLPPLDMSTMSAEDILKFGERKREKGNLMFHREEYSLAISAYSKALRFFETREQGLKGDDSILKQLAEGELKCYNNMAAAQLKIGACDAAIRSSHIVLKQEPNNVKALYRMGKGFCGRGDTVKAIETLKKAIKLDPESKLLHRELSLWTQKRKREVESEKNMYKKMMGSMADAASLEKKNLSDRKVVKVSLIVGGIMAAIFSVGFAYYRTAH